MVKTPAIMAWTTLKSLTSPVVSWKTIRTLAAKRRGGGGGGKPDCIGEWEKKTGGPRGWGHTCPNLNWQKKVCRYEKLSLLLQLHQ